MTKKPCVLQYMSVKDRSFCGRIKIPRKGAFTMNYSKELKDALLRRMLPPNNESITKISKEHYVPDPGNMFVMQEGEAYSRMTFGITLVLYFILSYTTIYYPTLQD